ncbi:histone deacetylase 8-like [Toxorhynchites rutilus septentrionalis]|uniref:histone deacetylase 8-like n=1 Tax=Toxorhynchites rutilus septentrionalis TaxID=329112 RepID=UPI00247A87AD|nr:histone deacetylase 8-like [Toxorhynchites rutilus septentrionalis]
MLKSVVYVHSEAILSQMRKLDIIENRSQIVHELIKSYGLLNYCQVIAPQKCSYEDLRSFHSADYVDCLKQYTTSQEISYEQFGLEYDCLPFEEIYDFVTTVAGSTLAAVDAIINGASIAINWNGGWHHAQRDKAAGFSYVNDIVIAIHRLRTKFQKVLYLDLDIHHGDGVEHAFNFSKYVMTISFHQYEPGFYPGTGAVSDIGFGNGRGYTINAPYSRYISSAAFVAYFRQIVSAAFETFQPQVCVMQCGADVIVGDRLGGSNLLPEDCIEAMKEIFTWNIPITFLGGGGYNNINTAKYWTQLTASILGVTIPRDIPENNFFLLYGPDYVLDIYRANTQDENLQHDLLKNASIIKENLNRYVLNVLITR